MNYFKLAGLAAGVAALAAVILAAGAWLHRYDGLKADGRALAACAALEARPGLGGLDCPPILRSAILTAAQARACDGGLVAGDAGAFAVGQACSAPVKRLVADRDKATHDAADAQALADQLTAHQSAAVARAEARGAAQTQRNAHATEVLNAAPRDAGGRTVCGPDCLRGLDGS